MDGTPKCQINLKNRKASGAQGEARSRVRTKQ